MKIFITIVLLLISSNLFSQKSKSAPQNKNIQTDSLKIIEAYSIWENTNLPFNPKLRKEKVNKKLYGILLDSKFYPKRLELEQTIEDYFSQWQTIADERYSYYVNNLSGSKSYKNLLRKLVNFGFVQENFFAKEGNMFYDYALLEYEGMVKIVVQVKINYANDISYDVFTYCY